MIKNQKPILISDLGMQYPTLNSKNKRRYGFYKCFCGKNFKAQTTHINSGHTISCGCYNIKKIQQLNIARCTTHGYTKHRLYQTWNGMIQRCYNLNNKAYKNYGGRGIVVCERWLNVRNFIQDMNDSFQKGLTLDRQNNDGNYEQSNCRWTTKIVQARNTRIIQRNNTSGYKGVSFHKRDNKFQVGIYIESKKIHLGYYDTALEAANAYNYYIDKNKLEHTKNVF